MSSFNKDRLMSLVIKSLENEINENEFQELSEILKQSQQAQLIYLEMVDLHTALDDKSFSSILKSKKPTKRKIKEKKTPLTFRLLSFAAILALAAGLFYLKNLSNFQVIVEDSQNAQVIGQEIINGQKLNNELIELKKGLISLKFSSGALIVLEGPAKLKILTEKDTELCSGKVFAYVPPKAKGFSVRVGNRKVIDLGTSFAIEASDNNELHVFDGLVELQEDKDNTVELKEGNALQFSKSTYPQKIKLNRKKFTTLESFIYPSKTFHFENGLEAWVQTKIGEHFDRKELQSNEQTKGNMRFVQSHKTSLSNQGSFGRSLCNAQKGSGRIIPMPFYARDLSKKVSVLSSPAFSLRKNGGDIQAYLHGGCGALEKLTGTLEQLGSQSNDKGFLGLALRRVSDNKYVASVRRKARERPEFRKGWEKVSISQDKINRILMESQPGEKFVLDLVDTFSYENAIWSWAALDTVTIPGRFDN